MVSNSGFLDSHSSRTVEGQYAKYQVDGTGRYSLFLREAKGNFSTGGRRGIVLAVDVFGERTRKNS